MATVSYGTITVTDLTDITDVYLEYCMVEAGRTASEVKSKTTWVSPEVEWNTIYPTWQSGYEIWIRQVQIKEGIDEPGRGEPYLDTAVNQINITINAAEANIIALQSRLKKIWTNLTNSTSYPAGTYAASGIENRDVIENDSSTYGYNTFLNQAKLALRYNAIDMTALTTNALTFYIPTKDSNNNWIQGAPGLIINSSELAFYQPSTNNRTLSLTSNGLSLYGSPTSTPDATLTSNGLKLVKGGIEAGTPNTNNFVYLSTDPYGTYTIHDSEQTDWKQIIGTNFGVRADGSMYATSANISGTIHAIDGEFTGTIYAESGSIGGFTIGSTELYSQDKTSAVGLDEGTYIGPNGFGISGGDALNTTYFTQDAVSIGGLLEWTAASGEEEQSNLSIYATEIYLGTLGESLVPSNLNFLQDANANDDFAIKTLLTNTITELSSHKTQIEENKEKAEKMITDFDNYYRPYITTTENNQNGYIQLKRKDNSNASSNKITDTKIEISINQQTITAFEGTLMRTTFGEFENLRMKANSYTKDSGYLTWIARSNGHLSLKVVK